MGAPGGGAGRYGGERFFRVEARDAGLAAGWYAETREGLRGPFRTDFEAQSYLRQHIAARPRKRVRNWHHGDGAPWQHETG